MDDEPQKSLSLAVTKLEKPNIEINNISNATKQLSYIDPKDKRESVKEIAMKARMQKNATLDLGPLRSRYKEENFNNDDISVIKSVKSDKSLS